PALASRTRGVLRQTHEVPRQARSAEVDSLTAERHARALKQPQLAPFLCHAPVRTDDAVPREVVAGMAREDVSDKARRRRLDVPVGLNEPLGDRPDAVEDALAARVAQGRSRARHESLTRTSTRA